MKGLKISNKNSSLPQEKNNSEEEFEKKADNAFSKLEARKIECIELGNKYKNILNDQTLVDNKSPLVKDLEKEVIGKLINLSREMNNDELEQEGDGSVVLLTLVLRLMLSQRDKINELSYKLNQVVKMPDVNK